MAKQVSRILSIAFFLSWSIVPALCQNRLSAKINNYQPQPAAVSGDSDRTRDGLNGPVRRVRTEVVKVTSAGGNIVEGDKRVLLETAEYDVKGSKTQNQYFPIAGATLTGREVYKYDDKGNISEMTLVNADGSLVSKEVYKYEFDSVGNWVKMTTSIAVVENAKINFEPSEITYRTIFYYLDAAMVKMLQPTNSSAPAPTNPPTVEASSQTNSNIAANRTEKDKKLAAALPSQTSFDKLKVSASVPSAGD